MFVLFSSPRANTGPCTILVNLWPPPGETLSLISFLFYLGSKLHHPVDHENGASILLRSTLVNREICMQPLLKTKSAPERPAADSLEYSEAFQSAPETEGVVPCGSFLGLVHNTNTKSRVSGRSRIEHPFCSWHRRGICIQPP